MRANGYSMQMSYLKMTAATKTTKVSSFSRFYLRLTGGAKNILLFTRWEEYAFVFVNVCVCVSAFVNMCMCICACLRECICLWLYVVVCG